LVFFQKKEENRLDNLQERWGKPREGYYNFELISLYNSIKSEKELPEQTLNDFDFEEVFSAIDYTYSRVGQQFTFAHLQQEDISRTWLQWFEKVVNSISQNDDSHIELVKYLSRLDKTSDYYFPISFEGSAVKRIEKLWLIRLVQTTTLSSFVLLYFEPYFFFLFLLSIIVSTGIHYWNKWQVDKYQHVIKSGSGVFSVLLKGL
jgi:hypothetical protein